MFFESYALFPRYTFTRQTIEKYCSFFFFFLIKVIYHEEQNRRTAVIHIIIFIYPARLLRAIRVNGENRVVSLELKS